MSKYSINNLEAIASQVRRDIVRMVHGCQSGHPGGSLGCTDFFVALYFEIMDRRAGFHIDGIGEDLFFLSNGHISPVFYSVLARMGYFDPSELASFRKINSRVQGHPTTHEGLPGIRIASGSLGQGLSVAIGAAQSKKLNKVDNLVATVDYNGAQIDGPTEQILSLGNLQQKWEAFGWDVLAIEKGNDMAAVISGLEEARSRTGKGRPVMILLHTEMGSGVDFMMGSHKWHGVAPNDVQLATALEQLPETLGDY